MPSSFFALFDDIATLLDDVSVMTKVATKKTAGVLGDDLALNAQQVSGINADRELPVVWAVAKGSLLNKVILVPAFLLISVFIPWLITPLLMVGGAFLCFEGVEKILHSLHQRRNRLLLQRPQPRPPKRVDHVVLDCRMQKLERTGLGVVAAHRSSWISSGDSTRRSSWLSSASCTTS